MKIIKMDPKKMKAKKNMEIISVIKSIKLAQEVSGKFYMECIKIKHLK